MPGPIGLHCCWTWAKVRHPLSTNVLTSNEPYRNLPAVRFNHVIKCEKNAKPDGGIWSSCRAFSHVGLHWRWICKQSIVKHDCRPLPNSLLGNLRCMASHCSTLVKQSHHWFSPNKTAMTYLIINSSGKMSSFRWYMYNVTKGSHVFFWKLQIDKNRSIWSVEDWRFEELKRVCFEIFQDHTWLKIEDLKTMDHNSDDQDYVIMCWDPLTKWM